MGRIGATMPVFCLNRIRPLVRIRSPNVQSKNHSESSKTTEEEEEEEEEEKENNNSGNFEKEKPAIDQVVHVKPAAIVGRKIMVVVDSSPEAKNAIQWALTHTVQSHDLLILLYVTKASNSGDEANKEMNPRVSRFLSCMKIMCQQKRPEVNIEVSVAQGSKHKGPAIVEEAKNQGVALLVLGQKKRFTTTWRLLMMWAAGNNKVSAGGVVEYCIQNATCMAIAVRRKSKKLGGYLITTKRQKDFWLLA